MVKTQHIDVELLDNAISKSGFKNSHFCEKLGISKQSFSNKRRGLTAFRQSEVYVMCHLLNLTDDDGIKIFFPEKLG